MTLQTLDIWITLVGVFAMLALLCTSMTEFVEGWRKHRAILLHQAIGLLLGDGSGGKTALLKTFYEHPAINPLYEGAYAAPGRRPWTARPVNLPSYIPARSFALAVLDMAAAGGAPSQLPGPASGGLPARAREYGAYLGPSMLASQLRLLLDTVGDDETRVLDGLAKWYDTAMDRLSGRYKRRTLGIGFACGVLLAAALNVNPLAIVNDLRQSAVQAERVAREVARLQAAQLPPQRVVAELDRLDIPLGWDHQTPSFGYVRSQLFGWLLAGFAAMLGAPFWFDILNRLTIVRATVKPHEKSPEEPALDAAGAPAQRRAEAAGAVPDSAAQDSAASAAQAGVQAAAQPAGVPPATSSRSIDDHVDGCTCDLEHPVAGLTRDHELPVASGGVAS